MTSSSEVIRARLSPDSPTVSEDDQHCLMAALAPNGDPVALLIDLDALFPDDERQALPDAVPGLLNGLRQALDGAVVVVSASTVVEIDSWLSPVRLPALGRGARQWRADLGRPTDVDEFGDLAGALASGVSADERFAGKRLLFVGDPAQAAGLPPAVPVVAPPADGTGVERAQALLAALAAALAQRLV